MKNLSAFSMLLLIALAGCSTYPTSSKQSVHFVEPQDGAVVGTRVKVVMGIEGMEVKPVGTLTENTGHHHLLIDATPLETGESVPIGSSQHLHFGKGQTETTISLTPGEHTLILQFANGSHVSYGEKMRSTITVTAK